MIIYSKVGECPMCEPGTCVGGAHRNALAEDGIYTREQYFALIKKAVSETIAEEGMDGL